jgi:hypothetical protein
MPRKSADALAMEGWRRLNVPPPPPPPEPPEWLSDASAKHWRGIAASRPHDYWKPPAGDLLAHLCCHIAASDRLWREINDLDPGDPKQFRRYRTLGVMASRESRMISLLMTKLRLLPPQWSEPPATASSIPWKKPLPPWERHV